jgi:hypothetical protein
MKKILNIIPDNPYLVLVALNPTEEAISNGAVFSRDNGFWNLLVSANIIKKSIYSVQLKDRAKAVFLEQKHSEFNIGFADLLPLESEKDSKKIKVKKGDAQSLFDSTPQLKKAKRIALLGQKVVDSFARDFNLKKWKDLEVINEGKRQFGIIGKIIIENNTIEIFAMPFPINNNIENKHQFYSKLIKN